MSIKVQIPAPLRPHTNGEDTVAAAGATVAEALADLSRQHPALKDRVFEANGQLRRFVNLYLNDEDVRYLEQLETPVKPGDTLAIIPAVAGG